MIRITLAVLLALASPAFATPRAYVLQTDTSRVSFETDFGPDKISGQMPVTRADLTLDFDKVANSTVSVTLDVTGAEASFPFAAQAMRGPRVLDAGSYPTITFQSTRVSAEGDGARIEGTLTIRGQTRPATLAATIWRQRGSESGDLSHLAIRLVGAVNRSDFGATGWADMVGDQVRLDILARIMRAD